MGSGDADIRVGQNISGYWGWILMTICIRSEIYYVVREGTTAEVGHGNTS
jgi:hypothetical protein